MKGFLAGLVFAAAMPMASALPPTPDAHAGSSSPLPSTANPHAGLSSFNASKKPDPHAGLTSLVQPKGTLFGFIDFTARGTQPGLDFPLSSTAANQCSGCHGGAPLETHYPRNSWSGSMMANATRDPLFWAALDVANKDGEENGAPGIGDYCLRCHTPQGWYGGRVRKITDVEVVDGAVDADQIVDGTNGCLLQGDYDDFDNGNNDFGGITCISCHRQLELGPQGQPPLGENGDAWIDDVACAGGSAPCRGGPYNYPEDIPGWGTFTGPPHDWEYSAFQGTSAACGTCHDVTTPILESGPFRTLILDDGSNAGNDTGVPYPAERTYSEWSSSDFASVLFRDGLEAGGAGIPGQRLAQGESCQGCHMPQAEPMFPEDQLLACSFGPPRNGNLRVHEFVGGNTWIPLLLKDAYSNLPASEVAFDDTANWAQQMLSEKSALVQTTATLAPGGASINASVRVTNLSGHKLPTGYAEGRRMWIAMELRDSTNAVIWSNGAWDPATGALSTDAQTKVYEIKQGIWDATEGHCETEDAQGREQFHFVLNNCIAKDNRIPPLGFTGAQNPEMGFYAYSYPLTAPGSGRSVNFDQTPYVIPVPSGASFPLSVRATLRFQLATREYIEFLRNQAVERSFPGENLLCVDGPDRPFEVGPKEKSRGQYMYDLWNTSSRGRSPPVDMASSSATVAP